jgi:hypothetical protein
MQPTDKKQEPTIQMTFRISKEAKKRLEQEIKRQSEAGDDRVSASTIINMLLAKLPEK